MLNDVTQRRTKQNIDCGKLQQTTKNKQRNKEINRWRENPQIKRQLAQNLISVYELLGSRFEQNS